MNPKLVGTWFLVRNNRKDNKELMVTRADFIEPSDRIDGSFVAVNLVSGWMSLDDPKHNFLCSELKDLRPEDFTALNLPEVTYENSPVEIEIMPSGNVYFY